MPIHMHVGSLKSGVKLARPAISPEALEICGGLSSCTLSGIASYERPPGFWEIQPPPGLHRATRDTADGVSQRKEDVSEILQLLARDLDQRLQNSSHKSPLSCSGWDGGLSVFECPDLNTDSGLGQEHQHFSPGVNGQQVMGVGLVQRQEKPDYRSEMPTDDIHLQHLTSTKPLRAPSRVNAHPQEGATSNFETDGSRCKWHHSAKLVGNVSGDGHVFTKVTGADRLRALESGDIHKLGAICMVFDERVRSGGTHCYHYQILDGEIGAADGAGFVFDSKVRRCNLQRMRSIFLNNRGQLFFRNQQHVQKLNSGLPRLEVGMCLVLTVDLHTLCFNFRLLDADGSQIGEADVTPGILLSHVCKDDPKLWQTGFFFCFTYKERISVT
mmetsp:Transcript_157855/g.302939  ORF Transcript_157855/g.302939 Transcript_157855/m.302939 type:complete len:385 (+) Transcript_157855:128-1282(+)